MSDLESVIHDALVDMTSDHLWLEEATAAVLAAIEAEYGPLTVEEYGSPAYRRHRLVSDWRANDDQS